MFYLYLKSLLSHKDLVSQASQERSSLIYYKLNGHSICPSSILYLLKIFHRDFPSYPISISRVPLGILEILTSRLHFLSLEFFSVSSLYTPYFVSTSLKYQVSLQLTSRDINCL